MSRPGGPIPSQAAEEISCWRVSTTPEGPAPAVENVAVATEAPLTIEIDGVGVYTIMCTPTDTQALAVGFVFSEGLIQGREEIDLLQRCEDDPNVIRMRLAGRTEGQEVRRNLVVLSSCGLCGSRSVDELLAGLPFVSDELRLAAPDLRKAGLKMRRRQAAYSATGGTHAAAIFNAAGEFVALGEDIGRHNALDKAVGQCLLQGTATTGLGVSLSGRVSLEMVVKAAQAGLELISAVSAPTSLALSAAKHCNITLCAFVREERATVFTHRRRVAEAAG